MPSSFVPTALLNIIEEIGSDDLHIVDLSAADQE